MTTATAKTRKEVRRLRFPWWRRVLAPFSLAATVMIVGITLAAVAVAGFMLALYVLEQAVG